MKKLKWYYSRWNVHPSIKKCFYAILRDISKSAKKTTLYNWKKIFYRRGK